MSEDKTLIPITKEDPDSNPKRESDISIYAKQFLYIYSARLFVFYVFMITLTLNSIIGLFLLALLIISMYIDNKNRWRDVWIPMTSGSIVVFLLQIAYLFNFVKALMSVDEALWIGLGNDATSVITLILRLITIVVFGVFVWYTQRWEYYLVPDEAFTQMEKRFHPLFYAKRGTEESSEQSESYFRHSESILGRPSAPSDLDEGDEQEREALKKEFENLRALYYGKKFDTVATQLYHRHGYEIALFLLVVLAFYRLNVLSLFYVIIASAFTYFSHYFNQHGANWIRKLNRVKWAWRVVYTITAFDVLRQYFILEWFPPQWGITNLYEGLGFGCDTAGQSVYSTIYQYSDESDYAKCVDNFKLWLAVDKFSLFNIVMNFICLFKLMSYDNYFVPFYAWGYEKKHKEGDADDFTRRPLKSALHMAKFFVFCHFHQVALIAFIFVGLRGNIQGTTDLIGIFYLFVGIYLLYHNKLVYTKKNSIWHVIEIANLAVMVALIIYQMPWFGCPVALDGRYYYSNDECVAIQQNEILEAASLKFQDPGIVNKLLVLIGINKLETDKILGNFRVTNMMLFFLLAFIQRKIWNHHFMRTYVEPYMRRDQMSHERRGVNYVEKEHIKRISAYRNFRLKKSFLKEAEANINKKLILWEKLTLQGGSENSKWQEGGTQTDTVDHDHNRKMKCLKKLEPRILEKEIIDFEDLIAILKRNDYDTKKCYEEVCAESRKTKQKIREQLHNIQAIGLPPMREVREIAFKQAFGNLLLKHALEEVTEEEEKKLEESKKEEEDEKIPLEREGEGHIEIGDEEVEDDQDVLESSKSTGTLTQETTSFDTIVRKFLADHIRRAFSLDENLDGVNEQASYGYLIVYSILSSWTEVTYAVILMNFLIQPNLISFFLLLTVFAYAIVEYPTPSRKYWKFLIWYVSIIMLAKYLYQLPFFCSSSSSEFFISYFGTEDYQCVKGTSTSTLAEVFELFGIKKFTEYDEGVLAGVGSDFTTLLVLIIQRWILKKRGVWHHVGLTQSSVYVPQFEKPRRVKKKQATQPGRPSEEQQQEEEEERRKSNICQRSFRSIENFIFNLFPHNFGLEEVTEFNIIKKPGRDYHIPTVVFLVIIAVYLLAFFTTITGRGPSITQSLNESSFSGGMVISVAFTLVIILVDRVLYISREDFLSENNQIGKMSFFEFFRFSFGLKVLLHYFLTILLMTFIYMQLVVTKSSASTAVVDIFCILAACFLFCSGSQVKWGYPLYSSYHAFQSPDKITGLTFKTIRAIPFVTEVGSILDWTFTKTSLDLFQWMKLEDAWAYLYIKSCENNDRKNHHFGEPAGKVEKFFMGFCTVLLIMLIIIGPLALFSTLNPNEVLNNISSGTIAVTLMTGGSQHASSIFQIIKMNNLNILTATQEEFDVFNGIYDSLDSSNTPQLQKIILNPSSDEQWTITPPSFDDLLENLKSPTKTFFINIEWDFNRVSGTASGSNSVVLTNSMRNQLIAVLQNQGSTNFTIHDLFPKYLYLASGSDTRLYDTSTLDSLDIPMFISCNFQYSMVNGTRYWMILSLNSSADYSDSEIFNTKENVIFYAYSEKTQGSIFGTNLGDLGVITIYATFVYAIGSLIRTIFDKRSQRIIYEDIPETRDIMELMEAIYTARREQNTLKEQALYELLIRIYRSPEVLMQLTGRLQKYAPPKEELVRLVRRAGGRQGTGSIGGPGIGPDGAFRPSEPGGAGKHGELGDSEGPRESVVSMFEGGAGLGLLLGQEFGTGTEAAADDALALDKPLTGTKKDE